MKDINDLVCACHRRAETNLNNLTAGSKAMKSGGFGRRQARPLPLASKVRGANCKELSGLNCNSTGQNILLAAKTTMQKN